MPTRGSAEDRKVVDLRGGVPARQAALDKWVWAGGDALVVDGAAAAVRVAEMHPVRAWVVLAVSPETPSADVVALVAAARHEAGRPLKLRTLDLGQVDTLIAAGARPLIESHLVTLDRDDLPSTWDLPEELLIHDRKPDEPEFLSAAWDLYRRIHQWDPVADDDGSPSWWLEDVTSAATIDDSNCEPIAVVCAHAGSPVETAYIGSRVPGPHEAALIQRMLVWLLDRHRKVVIEADDGDGAHPVLISVLRTIPGARWAEPLRFIEIP